MPVTPSSRVPSLPRNKVLVKKLICGISSASEMGAASFIISLLVAEIANLPEKKFILKTYPLALLYVACKNIG